MQCSPLGDGKPPQVPQLVHLHHNPAESEQHLYALKDGVTTVGSEGEIRLYGEGIEPHHCDIHNVNGEVAVAAANGVTYVNGKKVTALTPMGQGGRMVIGSLFFRLNNPNKKEWVNPPGYQYAYDEFKREQEIVFKRERRSRHVEQDETKRKGSMKPKSPKPSEAAGPPPALAIPEEPQLSPRLPPRSPSKDSSGDESPAASSQRPKLMLTRHLAATAAIRRPTFDSKLSFHGTYPPDNKQTSSEEVGRLRQELADMEAMYRHQLEEQNKKLEEERRRTSELMKSVASLEKRLKEKVKQDMCDRGEQLMTKMDELVKEAQQLTNMVGKPVQFTMRLQTSWDESNLSARTTGAGASFDAMQLDATVQVRDTRDLSKAITLEGHRFQALLEEMQRVHQRLLEAVERGEAYELPREADPWEKLFLVEQYVGCTRILLEDLLHNVPIEDLGSFLTDNAGNKVGQVKLDVYPCSPEGVCIEDDPELFVDDDEVDATWLGKRWDAVLAVRHLRLFNTQSYSHVFLEHTFWDDKQEHRSQIFQLEPGQHELAPDYKHQHTNPEVDALFLEYLKTRNIQLKVYAHVLNPEYVPVSTADDRVRRAVMRSSKLLGPRRSIATPPALPDASADVERLEAQCRQQKARIEDLAAQVQALQGQLTAATERTGHLEKELSDRDASVAELKQKKRELNQLLKSEKEKFLARQAQLKQKIVSLQRPADPFPAVAAGRLAGPPPRLEDGSVECVNRELLQTVHG
eukprot:EG_transcript_4256